MALFNQLKVLYMKKLALLLVCLSALLPASLSAGCFSFNVLFNAASLFCPPCYPAPMVVERHYCMPQPVVCYPTPCYPCYESRTVVREYHNPCFYEQRVITTRPCYPY